MKLKQPAYVSPLTHPKSYLGRYPILGSLLEEESFSLLLSEHPTLERRVALKTVSMKDARPSLEQELLREARLLSRLHHPNLPKLYDAGLTQQAHLFEVLEPMAARTLQEYALRYSPLPLRVVLSVFAQLLSLLEAVHREGYALCTLVPEYLSISHEALPLKLFDVSHAAPLGSSPGPLPASKEIRRYVAPELFGGVASAAADLFSVGVIVYELLTGEPFRGENPQREARARLKRLRALPKELAALVLSLLSSAPEARPSSASECAALLSESIKMLQPGAAL